MTTQTLEPSAPEKTARVFYTGLVYNPNTATYKRLLYLKNNPEFIRAYIAEHYPQQFAAGQYTIAESAKPAPRQFAKNWQYCLKISLDNQTVTYINPDNPDLSISLFFYPLPLPPNQYERLTAAGFTFVSKPLEISPYIKLGFYFSESDKITFEQCAENTGHARAFGLFLDIIEQTRELFQCPQLFNNSFVDQYGHKINQLDAAHYWREFLDDIAAR